ncbi:MAG: tRNA 2-thiocytidine biosynthesis TtcA family protein [Desulfurococcales archaeon]|nr:tRNA 2-thiocytidine biosynthesis TtcA family protein [Desulfurococcales archaeon]
MAKCRICGKPGFVYVSEYKGYLCKEHYSRFIESKVDRCVKRFALLRGIKRLLIGLSGGKDSIALLYIMNRLYGDKIELEGLHINLGIPGYSGESQQIVDKLSSITGIKVSFINLCADYGFSIKKAADYYFKKRINRPPCSVCGTVKRYLLNKYAVEKGFDAVATGHNLDDILRFASTNIVTGDVSNLVKQVPREESTHPKIVTKIRPLCYLSNKETLNYVEANNLPIVRTTCPYKPSERKLAPMLASKIGEIEAVIPGFKSMYINNLWRKIIPSIKTEPVELNECEICGMPTSIKVCSFCKIRHILTSDQSEERFL